ncbi:MAG: TetR/AcrR family transcriptional regulator [Actinobacteria bacterium]|nr:TetR/AcrR family transcriptional regulator [Actinomycetota bacterium]
MASKQSAQRQPLSRDRVLRAGVALADREGIAALSMRRLAGEVGYEVMSLYHYVANKDDLLDGMVELVAEEIELPAEGIGWREALWQTATGMRTALVRHPWAVGLWFSRIAGPNRIRLMEAQLAALADSGVDPELAHLAYHALLNHVLGYALQEQSFVVEGDPDEMVEQFRAGLSPAQFPHLRDHLQSHLTHEPPIDDFQFVVDLILDRLAASRE